MKFEIYKTRQVWRWRLKADNGEVIAVNPGGGGSKTNFMKGGGYVHKKDAEHAIGLVVGTDEATEIVQLNG